MGTSRARGAQPPVVIAIDHGFVGDGLDAYAQGVYDALGALDAAWPRAILPLATEDLRTLVAASLRWCETLPTRNGEHGEITGAVRRVRHAYERQPAPVPRDAARRPS